MAFSLFSGAADAITGGPKLQRITYSPELDSQLNALTQGQTAYQGQINAAVDRLSGAATSAAKQVEDMTPEDLATYRALIDRRIDPLQTYQDVGNYQFSLIDRIAQSLAQQGRGEENRRAAAAGYGGSTGGTYQTNTLLDRISRNLAPVYAGALSTIGRDAGSIDTGRLNQASSTASLINSKATVPGRSLGYYQIPIASRTQSNADAIAALLGLGSGFKQNTAGYREQQTRLGALAGGLDSAVETGTDLALSYFGGGGGGMLGGIMGGGGGGRQAQQPRNAINFQYTGGWAPPVNPYTGN